MLTLLPIVHQLPFRSGPPSPGHLKKQSLRLRLCLKDHPFQTSVFLGGRGPKLSKFADGGGLGQKLWKICRCLKWMVPNGILPAFFGLQLAVIWKLFCNIIVDSCKFQLAIGTILNCHGNHCYVTVRWLYTCIWNIKKILEKCKRATLNRKKILDS